MLEWLHVSVDRLNPASPANPEPFGPPPATPPIGVQIGQSFDVVAMRLRYAF
jgi:phosphate-selective porin OprO/OprP